ncbi:unnamed protein product [Somion occarium]|uniref:Uncharacterized protein n=1 Tax=Somion occarium TaxID=3059160 RepID=A0ABP1E533_9APHY
MLCFLYHITSSFLKPTVLYLPLSVSVSLFATWFVLLVPHLGTSSHYFLSYTLHPGLPDLLLLAIATAAAYLRSSMYHYCCIYVNTAHLHRFQDLYSPLLHYCWREVICFVILLSLPDV